MEDQSLIFAIREQLSLSMDSALLELIKIVVASVAGVFLFQLSWILLFWASRNIYKKSGAHQEKNRLSMNADVT